jgi:hypothetical protein
MEYVVEELLKDPLVALTGAAPAATSSAKTGSSCHRTALMITAP